MRTPHRHSAVFSSLAGFALAQTADHAIAQTAGDLNQDQTFIYEYMVTMAVLLPILLAIYLIPLIVAFVRHHPNRWAIAAINVALGGTGIAWLGSLVWAMGAVHKSPTGSNGGESGLNLFINDPVTVQLPEKMQAAATPDIGERLLRLKTLRDNGVITDDEYARLRQPLLGMLV